MEPRSNIPSFSSADPPDRSPGPGPEAPHPDEHGGPEPAAEPARIHRFGALLLVAAPFLLFALLVFLDRMLR